RVILREVQRVEVVPLGLGFGTDDAREAQLSEDFADLVHDLRDDVAAAGPLAPARHGEIDVFELGGAALELAVAGFDRALELALQRIGLTANVLAGLRIQSG